jgi:hypothetical protein
VLRFYRDFAEAAPEELGAQAGLASLPDGTRIAAIIVCYNGPIEVGEKILRPLREFGRPLIDQISTMSYVQLQSMQEAAFPPGIHCYWKSNFLRDLSDEAVEALVEGFQQVPSPTSMVGIEHLGGAIRRMGEDETAFDHRKAHFNLIIVGLWHHPAEKERHVSWTRELWNSMQPFSSGGVYVNYLGSEEDEGAERISAAYGPVKHERLTALKKKYDPHNLFRLNQNIRPKKS